MKQRLNINVDSDVYLSAKKESVNLSELVSDLLRQYFLSNASDLDEQQLLNDLNLEKEKLKDVQERISQLSVMLVHNRSIREKEQKEQLEQGEAMLKAARASGIAAQVFR